MRWIPSEIRSREITISYDNLRQQKRTLCCTSSMLREPGLQMATVDWLPGAQEAGSKSRYLPQANPSASTRFQSSL